MLTDSDGLHVRDIASIIDVVTKSRYSCTLLQLCNCSSYSFPLFIDGNNGNIVTSFFCACTDATLLRHAARFAFSKTRSTLRTSNANNTHRACAWLSCEDFRSHHVQGLFRCQLITPAVKSSTHYLNGCSSPTSTPAIAKTARFTCRYRRILENVNQGIPAVKTL